MVQSNSTIFSQDDQDCFASLSGDSNPVHLNPVLLNYLKIFTKQTKIK